METQYQYSTPGISIYSEPASNGSLNKDLGSSHFLGHNYTTKCQVVLLGKPVTNSSDRNRLGNNQHQIQDGGSWMIQGSGYRTWLGPGSLLCSSLLAGGTLHIEYSKLPSRGITHSAFCNCSTWQPWVYSECLINLKMGILVFLILLFTNLYI